MITYTSGNYDTLKLIETKKTYPQKQTPTQNSQRSNSITSRF